MQEHHKILIEAAVKAILGEHARVLRIVPVKADVSPWTREGRVSIQSSHGVPARTVRYLPDPGAMRR